MRAFLLLWMAWFCLPAANLSAQNDFLVLFYNTENLFDCTHDSLKNDREFLPESVRGWHSGRYRHKIRNLAKVITAAGGWKAPDLVGLCEVENDKVMDDLTKYSPLKEQGYRYVMTDSPDERGIDVALMYQRGSFRLLGHRSVRVCFTDRRTKPTRDILHATGTIITGDTLDVFVVHLPSRSGGEKESQPARVFAASRLKACIDTIMEVRTCPNILLIGDFNDTPSDRSVSRVLDAGAPGSDLVPFKLYNLMAGNEKGTYKYQGSWSILDQFIVSGNLLLNRGKIRISKENVSVCDFPFLLEEDEKYGGKRPFRTYYGLKYIGGFSDHLPVLGTFEITD